MTKKKIMQYEFIVEEVIISRTNIEAKSAKEARKLLNAQIKNNTFSTYSEETLGYKLLNFDNKF